jgi:threonine dehydrogenase-like Zn-dependent dehydrogenase
MRTVDQMSHRGPSDQTAERGRMPALVYHGPGMRSWEDRPRPAIVEAGDAIVRITTTTICGTDLHILGRGRSGSASC